MSNIKQSVNILEQAVNLAVGKGLFSIEEKAVIYSQLFEVIKYIDEKEKIEENIEQPETKVVKPKK